MGEAAIEPRILELSDKPDSWHDWLRDVRQHLDVLLVLAGKDFRTRYKRASLGVTWAVAVPVLQASVMAVVFSHVVRAGGGPNFTIYVMSGIIPFFYFSTVLNSSSISIVDGAGLSDKIWFPRVMLAVVPMLSNLVGLLAALGVLVIAMPVLGVHYGVRLLLLPVAVLMLIALVGSLSLVLSALYVYFRDVKYLVQAALMVWLYLTPIVYPISLLHSISGVVTANPLTGVVAVFRVATVGQRGPLLAPLLVTIGVTLALTIAGLEAQRRRDRLFVDLL